MAICEKHSDVIDENNQYKYGNFTNVDSTWFKNLEEKPHLKCNKCGQVHSVHIEALRAKVKVVCATCGNS